MQTFLPYPDIIMSVQCLDNKRLSKQRVEAMQILKALSNPNYGWQNHPAVKMWHECELLLEFYMNFCIAEWMRRGFNNSMFHCCFWPRDNDYHCLASRDFWFEFKLPKWFGNEDFHSSHKSNLLRKNKEYYSQYNWNVKPNLAYVWPVNN